MNMTQQTHRGNWVTKYRPPPIVECICVNKNIILKSRYENYIKFIK